METIFKLLQSYSYLCRNVNSRSFRQIIRCTLGVLHGISVLLLGKKSKQINFRHAMYGQIILIVIVSFLIPIWVSCLFTPCATSHHTWLRSLLLYIYIYSGLFVKHSNRSLCKLKEIWCAWGLSLWWSMLAL